MEKHHVEILRKNRIALKQQLKAERIASGLYSSKIFDQEDVHEVEACSTPERKAEALLDLLPKCGPDAFPRFYELLKDTQSHLADMMAPHLAGNQCICTRCSSFPCVKHPLNLIS